MTSERLSKLQATWESLAQNDPLWAILAAADKRGGGWDRQEFFASGEKDVEAAMRYVAELWPSLQNGSALDFGCGVGRLSQALARRFERVTGVDISPTMLELARQYDSSGGRCEYLLNTEPHLQRFADSSFDFIFSLITLQHMEPRVAQAYLREFVRVLRPGGMLLFQLTQPRVRNLNGRLRDLAWPVVRRLRPRLPPKMEMHGMSKSRVVSTLQAAGGRILDTQPDNYGGKLWPGLRYAVTKD